jgi:hypothetical protein
MIGITGCSNLFIDEYYRILFESISVKCSARLASKGFGLNVIYFRGEIREIFIERRRASFDFDESALRISQRLVVTLLCRRYIVSRQG